MLPYTRRYYVGQTDNFEIYGEQHGTVTDKKESILINIKNDT
jgi:hypothetical protein